MAYTYTNSRGIAYTLYARDIRLKSGHARTIYYFALREPKAGSRPLERPPDGYEIGEGRNGLPHLRKMD